MSAQPWPAGAVTPSAQSPQTPNAVQDLRGRDRIGLLAADRRSEGFKFGQQRIEAFVLNHLEGGRCVVSSARPLGRWREAEPELRSASSAQPLVPNTAKRALTAVTSEQQRVADMPFARPNITAVVSASRAITRRWLRQGREAIIEH